jgi:hypothetical protein
LARIPSPPGHLCKYGPVDGGVEDLLLAKTLGFLHYPSVAILLLVGSCVESATSATLPCEGGCAVWPDEVNILNVKKFGAKGDGVTDDTRAIGAAIAAAEIQRPVPVYFPEGVYRISDTLKRTDKEGHPTNALNLLGASRDKTVLLLANSAAGFGDPNAPKPMVFTSSHLYNTTPTAGGKDWLGKGEGNQAFSNYVANLTIDVGADNPGAIGIDYLSNNTGSIRNVRIVDRSAVGAVGISMTRAWPGPSLLSNVEIVGFDTGVDIDRNEYSITIDTMTLIGQRKIGIRNRSNVVAMRKLTTRDVPVAVENLQAEALMVVIGGDLTAPPRHDPASPAFINDGHLQLRDVRLHGFGAALPGIAASNAAIDGVFKANAKLAGCDAPLPLPLPDVPAWTPPSDTQWVSVRAFGAIPNDGGDDTDAINRAFSSGSPAIVFPYGSYIVSGPLRIPSVVKRVLGLHSILQAAATQGSAPIIQVNSDGGPLGIEGFVFGSDGGKSGVAPTLIAHLGSRQLILRDIMSPWSDNVMVDRKAGAGELFVEDICCGRIVAAGKRPIWARQLNTEGAATPRIVADGTPLSILGLKTENASTIIDARHGAVVEVLGGLLYPVRPVPTTLPAFRLTDARMLLSYAESGYAAGTNYTVHVDEQAQGTSKLVTANRFPPRTWGRVVGCYDTIQ